MSAFTHARLWIEKAWFEMGRDFGASLVPVARFSALEVDDMAFPFRNEALETWFLTDGQLIANPTAKISRVPFIAFSICDARNTMSIQVNWAPRCGYGFEVAFDENGNVLAQKMRWVS
jgi:hypothetical protein